MTGALVGSSGAIPSYIMCNAMNRNFISVIAGGFGSGAGAPVRRATLPSRAGRSGAVAAAETAELLRDAKSVIIVPGWCMAVAQAQHTVNDIEDPARQGRAQGALAIHPVAGRMPGHMNVLLAGSQGALRHRDGDGRDQRGLPGH